MTMSVGFPDAGTPRGSGASSGPPCSPTGRPRQCNYDREPSSFGDLPITHVDGHTCDLAARRSRSSLTDAVLLRLESRVVPRRGETSRSVHTDSWQLRRRSVSSGLLGTAGKTDYSIKA